MTNRQCVRLAFTAAVCLLALHGVGVAQMTGTPETVLLWPNGAPGAVGVDDADRPSITIYRPEASGRVPTAVIVCPGGAYGHLAMDHEGKQVAEWLNHLGVTAVVLKYRIAPRYHHPAPMLDAQRALRYVRSHAADYGVAPNRIGIWGFSAGGHLASTTGTHFDSGDSKAPDPIDRSSSRPDFMILAYPVINLTEWFAHKGSRDNLLGTNPDPKLAYDLSSEQHVTAETPPAFLFHTDEDPTVPSENSVAFYLAMRRAKVPAEIHIYEHGKHGVGLAQNDPVLSTWPARLSDWMRGRGLLEK